MFCHQTSSARPKVLTVDPRNTPKGERRYRGNVSARASIIGVDSLPDRPIERKPTLPGDHMSWRPTHAHGRDPPLLGKGAEKLHAADHLRGQSTRADLRQARTFDRYRRNWANITNPPVAMDFEGPLRDVAAK
jgi:hypothetical protein